MRDSDPSVREDQETRDFLKEEDFQHLSMIDSVLLHLQPFVTLARGGLSVVEWKQDKKATEEMNQLFEEVYGG